MESVQFKLREKSGESKEWISHKEIYGLTAITIFLSMVNSIFLHGKKSNVYLYLDLGKILPLLNWLTPGTARYFFDSAIELLGLGSGWGRAVSIISNMT